MGFLRKLFGLGPAPDFKAMVQNGAVIIDVRSQAEYKMSHIKGSKCIPLENIQSAANKFKKDQPVILCCASGARSRVATNMLKSKGIEAYNGGGWASLNNKLNK